MCGPQDRGVYQFDDPEALPALLAEYGRLAAQLSAADPERCEWIHEHLRVLDEAIDRRTAALGITRL